MNYRLNEEEKAIVQKMVESGRMPKEAVERYFPELAESEDEKIRKSLIDMLKNDEKCYLKEIAWLEKRGEHKPIFRAGDTIKKKSTGDIVTISEVDSKNKEYRLTNTGFIPFEYESLWQLVEQKPEYPLANEKMETERWKEACKAACSDRNYRSHYGLTETRDDYFVDGVQWADEHPLQKSVEWSKEDEEYLKAAIWYIENPASNVVKNAMLVEWVKNLKDRCCHQNGDYHEGFKKGFWKAKAMNCHWKPTEEQIEALDHYVNDFIDTTGDYAGILKGLLKQLKSL